MPESHHLFCVSISAAADEWCFFFSGLRERNRGGAGYGGVAGHNLVCILYAKQRGGRHWKEVGRTGTARNHIDPEWDKTFQVEYFFEEKQVW